LPLRRATKLRVATSTGSTVPTIDGATPLGSGQYSGASAYHYPGTIIPFAVGTTGIKFFINCDSTSVPVMGFAGASFIGLATANIGFVVRASVPISGW
jgi:hypothetical protein